MQNHSRAKISKFPLPVVKFTLGLVLLIGGIGCSSDQTSREKIQAVRDSSHAKAAAIGMDAFWLDYRSPADRPVDHWEFYYKHCSLISRKPYMDQAEYMCTNPY